MLWSTHDARAHSPHRSGAAISAFKSAGILVTCLAGETIYSITTAS
jgi:hypothetical protein